MVHKLNYDQTIKRFLNYGVLSYKQLLLSTIVFPLILIYFLSLNIDFIAIGTIGFISIVAVFGLIMIYSVGVKLLRNHFMKALIIPNDNTNIKKCEAAIQYLKTTKEKAITASKDEASPKKKQLILRYIDDIKVIEKELTQFLSQLKQQ